jgi:hypothetical protein
MADHERAVSLGADLHHFYRLDRPRRSPIDARRQRDTHSKAVETLHL